MSNDQVPEKIPEHNLHLLNMLQQVLVTNINTGPALEDKAWNILRFTSAAFGVAIAIGTLNKDTIDTTRFVIGFSAALLIHMVQMWFLWKAIKPYEYTLVPGVPSKNFTIEEFDQRYYTVSNEDYCFYLTVDYIGTYELPGAIRRAQQLNAEKAKYLNWMTWCLMAAIFILIVTSVGGILK